MSAADPYLTPQERRRQKQIERQLPVLRPVPADKPTEPTR